MMKINTRFAILMAAMSLAFASCVTGIENTTPPPPPESLVAPTADAIRASLVTAAPYCMEPGFGWSCITMDECTSPPDTTPVTDAIYEMTGLPDWLSFDPDTRELCLATGFATVPVYTAAIEVTYTCYSASDSTVTASVGLNINDCDGGGDIDAHEDANSAVPELWDNVGYISLTVHNVDEYLVPGVIGDRRRIRTNITDPAGMDVLVAADDTGDIDGDSIPNLTDPNVFVATSDATLTGSTLANAAQVDSIASGDLNNDGIPDLIVGRDDGLISTYLNNGAGVFALAFNNNYLIVSTVSDMAVADTEGSGRLGVVAAMPDSSQFILTGGDGLGLLTLNQVITIPAVNPSFIVAADFNGDNAVDVGVVTQADNTLRIYMNNGFGVVAAGNTYATCNTPTEMATADMDADGNMDMAVTCSPASVVRAFFGDGNGNFNAAPDYPAVDEMWGITVADFNNDGNLDFAMGSTTAGAELVVILCNGDRTCHAVKTFDVNSIRTVVAADMNGDGFPDIVGTGGPGLRVFINDGTGLGYAETTYDLGGPNGLKITAADFTGDNMIDLALTNSNGPGLQNINIFLQ